MKKNMHPVLGIAEFEQSAQALITLMFDLCEMKIRKSRATPAPDLAALTSSALALQNAITSFLAVAKLSE